MNTYSFDDENFKNSVIYKKYIDEYSGLGMLGIRAYVGRETMPVDGLDIEISTIYSGAKIIFFKGKTDESGTIEKIKLPAPLEDENDLEAPNSKIYDLKAKYRDNIEDNYEVKIYDGICTLQNIKIANMEGF